MTPEQLKEWLASRPACCAGGREAASDELARRRLTKREVEAIGRAIKLCGYSDFHADAKVLLGIKERFK